MKFLLITPAALNENYGGSMRVSGIRDALRQIGETHTVVFQWDRTEHRDADWNDDLVRQARYSRWDWSPEGIRQRRRFRRWIGELITQNHYDAIVVRFLGHARVVPRSAWPRLIVDADDAFPALADGSDASVLRRLLLKARTWWATTWIASRVGHVWYVHPADGPRLRARSKSLLRNVIRFPDPARPRAAPVSGRILMVGLMTHQPNLEGLRWFTRQVLPALAERFADVELQVIGRHEPGLAGEFAGQRVTLRGFVADLAPEYDHAALVIAPVFAGGGTQIKVIDALAHGRPLVASSFAWSGFAADLAPLQHLLVADTTAEWIDRCGWVLEQRRQAEALAARGHAAVAPYDARTMAATVRQTLDDLLPGTSGP